MTAVQAPETKTEIMPPTTEEVSTNFYWTFGNEEIFNMQTTVRGEIDPDAIGLHIARVRLCLHQVIKYGGHAKQVGRQPEPVPAPNATAPIPPAVSTSMVPPPPAAPNGNGANQESMCAMLEIGTSYTGNKPQLKFHVNGMDRPLSYTKEIGDMARLLAPLGFSAAHIVVGQKYPVNCVVVWKQGEKYRDVLSVRAA